MRFSQIIILIFCVLFCWILVFNFLIVHFLEFGVEALYFSGWLLYVVTILYLLTEVAKNVLFWNFFNLGNILKWKQLLWLLLQYLLLLRARVHRFYQDFRGISIKIKFCSFWKNSSPTTGRPGLIQHESASHHSYRPKNWELVRPLSCSPKSLTNYPRLL